MRRPLLEGAGDESLAVVFQAHAEAPKPRAGRPKSGEERPFGKVKVEDLRNILGQVSSRPEQGNPVCGARRQPLVCPCTQLSSCLVRVAAAAAAGCLSVHPVVILHCQASASLWLVLWLGSQAEPFCRATGARGF